MCVHVVCVCVYMYGVCVCVCWFSWLCLCLHLHLHLLCSPPHSVVHWNQTPWVSLSFQDIISAWAGCFFFLWCSLWPPSATKVCLEYVYLALTVLRTSFLKLFLFLILCMRQREGICMQFRLPVEARDFGSPRVGFIWSCGC